jgi:hypothetical protein
MTGASILLAYDEGPVMRLSCLASRTRQYFAWYTSAPFFFAAVAFLTPDIVSAIVAGERPNTLTIGSLLRDRDISLSWAKQRRLFGFRDPGDASR